MGSNPAEGANQENILKKYSFCLYDPEDFSKVEILTEEEIFQRFWNYWYNKIWTVETPNTTAVRDMPLALQRQMCIEDYVVVHWGVEVKD